MEKNKSIIAIVAIVLIALIGFNFDAITGNFAGNFAPDVTAFPSVVKAGEKINIKVKPIGSTSSGCVDPEIGFYFSGVGNDGSVQSSGGRKAVVTKKGGFKICKGDGLILDNDGTFTVNYQTRPEWDGQYFAKIFYWKDRKTKESMNVYFDVLPKGS